MNAICAKPFIGHGVGVRQMTAREILALLFRHRRWLAVCLFLPLILAGIAYSIASPRYTATTRLLLASNHDQGSRASLSATTSSDTQTTKQEVINSELEILTGGDLETAAVKKFGLDRLFPGQNFTGADGSVQWDRARRAFDHSLSAKVIKNSEVIEVSYEALNAALAQEVLDWYITAYQQKHVEVFAVPMAAFLNQELEGLDNHLGSVEKQIADYRVAHSLYGANDDRKQLLDRRSTLATAAAQVRSHAVELQARLVELKAAVATTPQTTKTYAESEQSDALTKAQSQLLDLQVQERQLSERYKDDSVPVQTVKSQIATVQKFLSGQQSQFVGRVRTGRNPLYDELLTELARAQVELGPAQARAAELDDEVAKIDQQLDGMEQAQVHIDKLSRDRDTTASSLKLYRERQQQAQLQEAMDQQRIVNIRQIESATTAQSGPKLPVFIGVGLAFGLFAAAATLALIFGMGSTHLVPESLERAAKLPVFVSLPYRQI
ncbi:MAG: lipopolysaccharide biosynthesis protein [Rhodospirillales bacterium]|nr:lipopolysaccharide biosynthesis protein [Rhodospirillales bacterium]